MSTRGATPIPAAQTSAHDRKLSARGEAARARLKHAAREVLERIGYHRMRIQDVTEEAGVAAGLFYHYFTDLKSLTLEVLEDFVAESRNLEEIEKGVPKGDWYGRMYAHARRVVDSYADRPGLMRCLLQMADEDEKFARMLRENYIEQLRWLVRLMPKLFPKAKLSEHQALMVVYAIASSGEMLLRDYFVNEDPQLRAEEVDREELTELMAAVFYRALFLANPPAEKLRHTAYLGGIARA